MSRMGIQKGKRGEREVVTILQSVVNEVCLQHPMAPKLQRTGYMQSDCGGFDIAGLDWLGMEVKRCETEHLDLWWEQCKRQAKSSAINQREREPVLIHRQNGRKWRVRMFGALVVNSRRVRCPVDISLGAFIVWFRLRLEAELK